ncbi:MAG: hypothetical protein JRH20_18130 [Deltaproteobacteria bacterium]|nr:hypothetical protein [Deltaproteobacteria bacterium]
MPRMELCRTVGNLMGTDSANYLYKLGKAHAVYALSRETLSVTLPGRQVGKGLHEVEIPLRTITGFYVAGAQRPASANAEAIGKVVDFAGMPSGELWVGWKDGRKRRRKAMTMLDTAHPDFGALIGKLARLRPDADLRGLSRADAQSRLGMMSDTIKALLFIGAVLLALALYIGGSSAWNAIAKS